MVVKGKKRSIVADFEDKGALSKRRLAATNARPPLHSFESLICGNKSNSFPLFFFFTRIRHHRNSRFFFLFFFFGFEQAIGSRFIYSRSSQRDSYTLRIDKLEGVEEEFLEEKFLK